MTLPRPVFPGRFLFITRRCTQRQFLLRPDDATNNAFVYCLAVAAKRYGMIIIGSMMMSNHHHTIIYDPHGNEVAFRAYFHLMLAKSQNVLRDRDEHFWSTEEPSVIELLTPEDLLAKLIYTAINPVKDDLVDRVEDWPGPNFLHALLEGTPLVATRPKHYFDAEGDMPEEVQLQLSLPDELAANKDAFLAQLRAVIPLVEQHYRAQRQRRGRLVLGARRVRGQSPNRKPQTREPRRALRPRFASRFTWIRVAAIQRDQQWQQDYREARDALKRGEPAMFPYGTYWLSCVANVKVRPRPPTSTYPPILN
jgi:putative transposase